MTRMIVPFVACAALCLSVGGLQAHEFWIEPEDYMIDPGSEARATFNVGEKFKAPSYSFIPGRSTRFDVVQGDIIAPHEGFVGDNPAFQLADPDDGLLIVVHETKDMSLTYSKPEKWARFRDHKALDTGGVEHSVPFVESYRRFAKALIGVGTAQGRDRPMGLRTEIVALVNPYTGDLSAGFPIQVLLEGAPRPGAQVELFEKDADGKVEITLHTTNAEGIVALPVREGHSYLADAVALIPLADDPDEGPVWETLWAALTFAVP